MLTFDKWNIKPILFQCRNSFPTSSHLLIGTLEFKFQIATFDDLDEQSNMEIAMGVAIYDNTGFNSLLDIPKPKSYKENRRKQFKTINWWVGEIPFISTENSAINLESSLSLIYKYKQRFQNWGYLRKSQTRILDKSLNQASKWTSSFCFHF